MEKIELFPYQRVANTNIKNDSGRTMKTFTRFFTLRNITMNIIAFIIGRAVILLEFTPFGLPFYAAYFSGDIKSLWIAISVIVGMMTKARPLTSVKYTLAIILFTLINLLSKSTVFKRTFPLATLVFICLFMAGMPMIALQGLLLYDILMLLFESFICFVMVYIFRTVMPILTRKTERRILSNEETIGLSILLGVLILGFVDIRFLSGMSLKNTLCIFIILLFALKHGIGVAASTGVTIGLINSMSSPIMPYVIGSYAFCALISGVFKTFGKIGVSLGFILANAILTIYINGSTEVLINIYDIFVAIALLSIIPKKQLDYIGNFLNKNTEVLIDKKEYTKRIKEITVDKLNNISKSFEQLSSTFNNITDKNLKVNRNDVSVIFDQAAERVCKDCGLSLCCWEREFHNTYQVMFKILEKLEEKGRIDERDVPQYFAKRCIRIEDFVHAINSIFEIYKTNLIWKDKVGESRGLVSQQLKGISRIISNLAVEVTVDLQFDERLEKEIIIELDKVGIVGKDITVLQNSKGKYEVDISIKSCGGMRKCIKNVTPIVSRAVGRKMVKTDYVCGYEKNTSLCTVKYIEGENFSVATGVARANKNGQIECGDNYSFMKLSDGQYILALSDGMGSGKRASRESNAAISLLEQFLESGFDKDTAVKLINSVLILKSPDECFTTIDLSVLDLYTGNVEFVKIGAAATFIKKKDRVEVVRSTSLPVGILNNVDMELSNKKVSENDYIVMITDGILDSNQEVVKKEEWVKGILKNINTSNPQELADKLLNTAIKNSGNKVNDDMTVLVVKIWKKVS